MFYTVYKTTNKINGKIYIGVHKTNNLDDDYLGSGKHLGYAIDKYGIENFEKEILAIFEKSSDMFKMESELVNDDFVERDDTYNIKLGGHGGFDWINENKNSKKYIDQRVKNGKSPQSQAALKQGIATQKWLSKNNPEWCIKRSESLSRGVKKYYKNGGKNGFKGKKHTEEFKKKIGSINSKKQFGSGNSQYGTMWIYNLELKESKRIMKTDPIPEGWLKGRKIKF